MNVLTYTQSRTIKCIITQIDVRINVITVIISNKKFYLC